MKRCILFLRVSTHKQSLDSQEVSLREQAHNSGFTDEQIHVIKNTESASKLEEEEREGLNELYREIDKGDVDCVRIWELSRLSRKVEVLTSIRKRLLNAKVQLYCNNPQFTLLTEDRTKIDKMSDLVFSIFSILAEQEIIEKKERFARGKRNKALKGRFTGGQLPFGYCYDKDTKIIIPEEIKEDGSLGDAALVRTIFNLYENGISQVGLAKYFYERGRTQLTSSLINNILTNRAYTGEESEEKVRHANRRGKPSEWTAYPRRYPVIITKEQFERCREIAKANNTKLSKARNVYLADGIIRCPECGRKLQAVGSRCVYFCRDAHNINKEYSGSLVKERCSFRGNASINVVDSLAWDMAAIVEMNCVARDTSEQVKDLQRQIEDVKELLSGDEILKANILTKKERIAENYEDGIISKDQRNKRLKEVDDELSHIYSKEAEHLQKIERLRSLIESIQIESEKDTIFQRIFFANGSSIKAINSKWGDAFIDEINENTTPEERQKIVRKNLRKITIEDVDTLCDFKHKGTKVVRGRLFTAYSNFQFAPRKYLFIANTGDGGRLLLLQGTNTTTQPIIAKGEKIKITYRYTDSHKYSKRHQDRQLRKQQLAEEKGDALSVSELSKLINCPVSTIHSAISRGHLIGEKHGKERWISKADADVYIENYLKKQQQ